MKKRIFSILLALCLAAGLASVPALAVDGEESAETSAEITLETSGEAPVEPDAAAEPSEDEAEDAPAPLSLDGEETDKEYDLTTGSITVTVDENGKQWVSQVNGVTNEEQTGKTVIKQLSTTATTNTITIKAAENQTAKLTLSGVNIDVSGTGGGFHGGIAAVSTSGNGNVLIELDGDNTVKSGNHIAGIHKVNTGRLTISDEDNNGSLDATGGRFAAGIGSGYDNPYGYGDASNIVITGGRITARGGKQGAGIGSGYADFSRHATNITITGGAVTAIGGDPCGAGIGGGNSGSGSYITISGGVVVAKGGLGAAGIGGGLRASGSHITVSGPAQLKVQGGGRSQYNEGAGAPIGNGGDRQGPSTPIDGAEVAPDTSALTVCGKIEYYAQSANMEVDDPTQTIPGTTGSHTLSHYEAKAATCTETGHVEHWHCSVCGRNFSAATGGSEIADVTTPINPTNHSGTAAWTQTATTHEKKWNCCQVVVVASEPHEWDNGKCSECDYECLHSGGTPTCKDRAVCEICNEEYGELAPQNHTGLKHIEPKEATREAEGNIEYWCCDGCGKYYKDPDAVEEITKADTVIAKLAPTPAPSPAPTAKAPPTGDESNLGLWIAILVVCSVLALAVVVIRKKK